MRPDGGGTAETLLPKLVDAMRPDCCGTPSVVVILEPSSGGTPFNVSCTEEIR